MAPLKRRRAVMIIDDDKARRKRIYDVLKLMGLDLYSAASGDEAMGRIPRDKPELVIVNTFSARADGIAFIQELRTYGMGQRLKVLGMLDEAGEEEKAARMAGADEVFQADIAPYRLLELVAKQYGLDRLEIPEEQMVKRPEVVEKVVADYRHTVQGSQNQLGRPASVALFLPGGGDPLRMLTDDAGK